jgi:hypothetical protein
MDDMKQSNAINAHIKAYIKQIAAIVRVREANILRGRPEALVALEHRSDVELVTRWAWTSAIVGAIATFLIAPFVLSALYRLLPTIIYDLLWFLLKVVMGCVMLMFAAAAWLTFKPISESE